jgi:FkbM family methyltransferase
VIGPKQAIKMFLSRALGIVGRAIPSYSVCEWCSINIVPWLLDESILPQEPIVVRLRNGEQVLCDPYNYAHRISVWFGYLYERELELFLHRNLKEGDTFIDVGANYGHFSIVSATRVGQRGHVYAFEPLPQLSPAATFAQDVYGKCLKWHSVALGSSAHRSQISIPGTHRLGKSSLRSNNLGQSDQLIDIEVRVGDDELANSEIRGLTILKMDVEGYEREALEGLTLTLKRFVSYAVVEVSPAWIGGQKGVQDIFGFMSGMGFQAHEMTVDGIIGKHLDAEDIIKQCNVVFVK